MFRICVAVRYGFDPCNQLNGKPPDSDGAVGHRDGGAVLDGVPYFVPDTFQQRGEPGATQTLAAYADHGRAYRARHSKHRMKIRIERADDISVGSSVFHYLLVGGGAKTTFDHMNGIPSVRAEQLDGGAWKPLVEQHSNHALSTRRI